MTTPLALVRPEEPHADARRRRLGAAADVARAIVRGLESGGFAPGQRLIEADLCLRYSVGRNAVREALQRLASEGVVTLHRNRGAVIAELSLADAIQTLEVTELLAGLAARSAARAMVRPDARQRMAAVLDRVTDAARAGDSAGFADARRAFYATQIHIGGNAELTRIFPRVQVHVLRAQYGFAGMIAQHAADYAAIGAAILSGDAERAEALSRAHVRGVRQTLKQQNDALGER